MSVQYAVQADVFDIRQTNPQGSDCFLVDSNVWLWMTYSNAGHDEPNWRAALMAKYVTFVQDAVINNGKVYCCGLSLAELSHIIEKTEREIHEASTGTSIKAKEYRHNFTIQRTRIVVKVQNAWNQVFTVEEHKPLSITIDSSTTTAALNRLQTEKVDGYDLFILESMRSHGVEQVITDDGDFVTVPGIQVFTANRNALQAARAQGRLITR
ncbi:MAG TPA: PIN domain-containing protein [Clostridiaceae bacterium]|jgi:predicted nucleic acid-binding protein|nr:PIN domain-containing protein [Clostridiaceae bacterium]